MHNLTNEDLKKYYQLYKDGISESKRFESCKINQMDVKFLYHVVRLLDEVEQILTEGDLDLMRNREQLKSIRRGEWKMEDIESFFTRKEKDLETVYSNSKLPHKPDEKHIRLLLLDCLEEHFGDLSTAVVKMDDSVEILRQIKELVKRV